MAVKNNPTPYVRKDPGDAYFIDALREVLGLDPIPRSNSIQPRRRRKVRP